MYRFSKRSLKRLEGVNPKMIDLMNTAIVRSPIDFGIPADGGKRTAKRQKELFDDKDVDTNCDGIIKKSYHQSGNAVDIYAYVNGKPSWDKVHLALIAGVILSIAVEMDLNIRWGGTFGSKKFKGWDQPHFELKK